MTLERYDVKVRSKELDDNFHVRELTFQADDFAHAEEQAKPYVEDYEEIIGIEKDYEVPYEAYSN